MPTQGREQHLFGFFLHAAVEQRFCQQEVIRLSMESKRIPGKSSNKNKNETEESQRGPTLDEGIAYDDVLSSILRQKELR